MRQLVLLGSTGSVGTQAVEVVKAHPTQFKVVGLAAAGSNVVQLARQAFDLGVEVVGVADSEAAPALQHALHDLASYSGTDTDRRTPKIVAGPDAATQVAGWPAEMVVNAITGSIGLLPTLAALRAGRTLALANKESLIVGGPLVKAAAEPGQIVPVDSEHSALAQCLRSGGAKEVSRLVLTASGGPFRGWTRADMGAVSVEQALAHPTWDMGPVVTVNSATLVNKGLELIEAHLLFDIAYDRIDVVIHPQSVVHSMVEFVDGSTLLQASPPDMRLPIALALGWPDRVPGAASPCDWTKAEQWDFSPLADAPFAAVALAREAGMAGGTAPAVYNAANEECVTAFLAGNLPFLGIVDCVASVLHAHLGRPSGAGVEKFDSAVENELTLDDVLSAEQWARQRARQLLEGAA